MRYREVFLVCAFIALGAGLGAVFVPRFLGPRAVRMPEPSANMTDNAPGSPTKDDFATAGEVVELRNANTALAERLSALEARLFEASSTRTPIAPAVEESASAPTGEVSASTEATALLAESTEVTPTLLASVGRAMDAIKAREQEQREAKRKEMQAERIMERVAKLQLELGLTGRQTNEMRDALIAQDDWRDALFSSMRDGLGDPRDTRDGFRKLRDESHRIIQGILAPDQFESFLKAEDDFGRRGPPDGAWPPGSDLGFGR